MVPSLHSNGKVILDQLLRGVVEGGYKPTRDQAAPTRLADLQTILARNLRSFRRLESALSSLTEAIRCGSHIASPA